MNSPESRKAQENSFNQEYLGKQVVRIQELVNTWEDTCLYAEDEDEALKDKKVAKLEKEIEEVINKIIEAINRLPEKTISRQAHDELKKIEQRLQEIQNQVLTNPEAGGRAKDGIRKIKNVTNALQNKIATLHKEKVITKEKDPTTEAVSELKEEITDKMNHVKPKIEGSIEPLEKATQGARTATADGASVAKEILESSPNTNDEKTDPRVISDASDEDESPQPDRVAPPPITIDLSGHYSRKTQAARPEFESSSQEDALPEPAYKKPHAIAPKPSAPRPKSLFDRVGNLARAAVLGIAAFLGLSQPQGEKAPETSREQDRITDTAETNEGNYQETPPVTLATEEITEESESLTETYTLKPGDSFWRIAEGIIKNAGGNANDTTAVLEIVRELKKENPEVAKRTWAGAILDIASANELARRQANELRGTYEESLTEETGTHHPLTQETNDNVRNKEPQPSQEKPSGESTDAMADVTDQEKTSDAEVTSGDDKLTHPYLQRGETIWSRTHDMLFALGMKPNIAKRGVLGAIILKDSSMNETQAMRIKAEGSKNFDPEKHRLRFERAKQAAEDLQRGMSPAEVAKKYGVKDVYEKMRKR